MSSSHIETDNTPSAENTLADHYRKTVFLPRTSFPMRGNLPVQEPKWLERWRVSGLDERLAQQAEGRPPFTLHDGPPYANGNLHIGHALNKVNKDVINRAHRMAGYGVRYVPGWDCHGLPIEWKVEEGYRKAKRDKENVPILEFRAECRAYAAHWLQVQMEEFRRLGVQGEWHHRYATMDFASEAAIVEEIGRFLLNGKLYRGLRPVMWSPVEKTALAEAEIEYHDHTSTTILVAFPIIKENTPTHVLADASIVIWTTTPWTIPANRALAYGPEIPYAVLKIEKIAPDSLLREGVKVVVAEALVESFCREAHIESFHVLHVLPGVALNGVVCAHPLRGKGYEFDVPLLAGDFVTTEAGTGLVHQAPAHGEDDFRLCRTHGIDVPEAEVVQADGTYAPWVPCFAGVHVFKVADVVCDVLSDVMKAANAAGCAPAGLVSRGQIVHSYPHSWRSRAPVIYRATPQWFIRMDGQDSLREQALTALESVAFIPRQARNRLTSMIKTRPDWCISRQRVWGVPIAVFVEKRTGQVLRDAAVMQRVVDAFRQEGADAWYTSPPERFLGADYDAQAYEQVFDIVDVWFESGSTHAFVLGQSDGVGQIGLNFPADLYLEGSDQHRGWFQSSLLESVGTRGVAPFRALLTNGFVLDEQGRKMSKSLGNVIAPQDVNETMGADILRLWVMNSDTNGDQRIGRAILEQQAQLYRRLRNTLRWLLGGLEGFTDSEIVPYAELPELERWVLYRLTELGALIARAVETHEWVGVYPALHSFCTADLSAFYFDIRKDALYCDAPSNPVRRAVRTVLDCLHRCLTTWLAPVLVFTAEESWTARFGLQSSVHEQLFMEIPAEWEDTTLSERWMRIRAIRRVMTTEIENARQSGMIGSSLQAKVTLTLSQDEAALFAGLDWSELAIVSQAEILVAPISSSPYFEQDEGEMSVAVPVVSVAEGEKCVRCWKVLPETGTCPGYQGLCLRCVDVVSSLQGDSIQGVSL
ncbi:MAG: isoleucine--tRNA ligase [Acetobacter sp.]|nr:isoleucine--tRNA ligase [Acetobacter sp.]